MRFPISVKLLFLLIFFTALPAAATASPSISIGKFVTKSGLNAPEFEDYLQQDLSEAGFSCSNNTESCLFYRYSLSGLVKENENATSFSALLTDNYHLEPEVFINGKQIGGSNSGPAARQLAKSVASLLSNQTVDSIEVSGNVRLTSDAVMALAQVFPGETVTVEKIVAARVILENCGLFEQAQLYLIPRPQGRKLKIIVKENEMINAGDIPGPGKAILDNILGPAEQDLPEFPAHPTITTELSETYNCTGHLAYEAGRVLNKFATLNENYKFDDIEELIIIAGAIRDRIYSSQKSCRNMCIILMKICSLLDSRTIKDITKDLQRDMESDTANPLALETTLSRIDYISQAQNAAQLAQLILASRLYNERSHSPVTPWVLYTLGEQSLKAEDTPKAAPLLAGSISASSLPVSPKMLITTAEAQYSNLELSSGDLISGLLTPLLDEPGLSLELHSRIQGLSRWASLCETATAVTDEDNYEMQLKKGDALILLNRPDLAEPLFHELHSKHPDDARPFTGSARLAFQRTGNLLSSRPYIERASRLLHKDRFFYEVALAYKLERIVKEALPTIHRDGRNSEEASVTRLLLPQTADYANGFEKFNKPQALLFKEGIKILNSWLAYPSITDKQALEAMFKQTGLLRDLMPGEPDIVAADYYFSIYSSDRKKVREMLCRPLAGSFGPPTRILQLSLLIREMATAPSPEIAAALEYSGRSSFSAPHSRGKIIALQADAQATLGFYHNSTTELERARSLYGLALDLSEEGERARLLNNQACVYLALGYTNEADNLFDEALDSSPKLIEAVSLGKAMSSLTESELEQSLLEFTEKSEHAEVRAAAAALHTKTLQNMTETTLPMTSNGTIPSQEQIAFTGMPELLLNEESRMQEKYDNYNGLQLIFEYRNNLWLLPSAATIQD